MTPDDTRHVLVPSLSATTSAHREPLDFASPVPQAPPLDPRLPSWTVEQLIPRRCPVCDSTRYRPVVKRPDGLMVAQCHACDLYYLPHIPSNEALIAFYARYSVHHQRWQSAKSRKAALKAARRRRGGNGILNEIAVRRPITGRKLIEFGCSTGSFLLDAREAGARVSGMELDVHAREFVSSLGISCHGSMAAALDAGPYDIAVALNVIEHLPQPKTWLEDIRNVMSPGGLLVLWTPNGGQAVTFDAGWVGFRVDLDHLTYFSQANLSRLLIDVGLWPEAAWEFSQANISGFRKTETVRRRLGRLLSRLLRAPVPAWRLPAGGGAFTLCVLAGKP